LSNLLLEEGKPVARVTVEDCLEKVDNRFALIQLAFQRVKQMRSGAAPLVLSKNKEIVVALREIAAGRVTLEQAQPALPPGQDLKQIDAGQS
jgi:DNA-directed RNA polymerase subunit omega